MTEESDGGVLSSLRAISEGAGLFFLGRLSSNGLAFGLNVVLTRTLGPSLYGIYAYLFVLLGLFDVFARLGGDKSVLRYVPEYEDEPRTRRAMVTIAYGVSLVASVCVAALVYYFAPLLSALTLDDPVFTDVLRIVALVLPFNTLANVTYSVFRSVERMDYNVAVSSVGAPLLRLAFVGGAVVLGYSVVGAVAGLVVSGVLTFAIAAVVLARRTEFGRPARPTVGQTKEYLDFSVPLAFTQVGSFLYNRVDVLMVGFLLTQADVAIYNVAVVVTTALAMPLQAVNQLFPPIASRLYHDDDLAELETVYEIVTRWIFAATLFPGLVAIVYAGEVLRVFGEGFSAGAVVLILFTVAQLTNGLVGPGGYLLMMSGHQYLTMGNQVVSGVLNAALNYVLITEFGFVGAAVATATVLAGINVLRIVEVWYLEGVYPYDRSFLKPVAAGVVAGAVMVLLRPVLEGYALLVGGGAAGAVAFVAVLALFGLEDDEAEYLGEMLPVRIARLA